METNGKIYPNFKNVSMDDCGFFADFYDKYPPYSDFNLLSLLSWNALGKNQYSILNDNLVIKIKDYLGDGFLYSLMGDNKIDESVTELLNSVDFLSFVPEFVISGLVSDRFEVIPDRDNFDYILSTENITKLEGHEFRHVRQDVLKFRRLYPFYKVKIMSLGNSEFQHDVLSLTDTWSETKNFSKEKQEEERSMLDSFIKYSSGFDCINVGLYLGDELIAYILSEHFNSETVISHFGVSNRTYECSAPMIEYVTARYLYEHGYKYQNQEQDAGLQGLRTAKLFFNPEYFLEKFTVKLKS